MSERTALVSTAKAAAATDSDERNNTCAAFCVGQRTPLAIMCYIGMAVAVFNLTICSFLFTGTLEYSTKSYNTYWMIFFTYAIAQFVIYAVWMGLKMPAGRAANVRDRGWLYAAYWFFAGTMLMSTTIVSALSQAYQHGMDGESVSYFEDGFCDSFGSVACVMFTGINVISCISSILTIAAGLLCVLAEIYTF